MRRVVVTGLGGVTPVGNTAESTWEALKAGRSGVGPVTTFDASSFPVRIAGMVTDFQPPSVLSETEFAPYLQRAGRFAVAAGVEALADARLKRGAYDPYQCGIAMGASMGRPSLQELSDSLYTRKASDGHELLRAPASRITEVSQCTANAALAQIGDCRGPTIALSTACAAAIHALGDGYRRIQDGEAKMMLAGGADSLTTWLDLLGFSLLGALTKDYNEDPQRASRPFDRDRSGFVLGEGAVVAVLEDLESALARGADIKAEIIGYSSSLNAYRMTDPPPDGGGAVIAINGALAEAGLQPQEIDYVVAHGTGTPGGDASETAAIKRAFGDHAARLLISSPKSMTGHTTCAAAALNLLAAVGAMRDGVVSPTINLENPDPELDLDFVANTAREATVRTAMVNAFAFGGTNGALVLCDPTFRGAVSA